MENITNNSETNKKPVDRNKTIVRTSIFAIFTNIFLVIFKAFVGIVSNSIAVILDAVNNASDALSSVITIAGAKLASKSPDEKHPFGYGRIEYLSAMIVSAVVMYAGITSAVESVKKIIHPETAEYNTVSLIILITALIVKFILGIAVRKQGKKVNSTALTASGTDALFDSILTLSVLVCALIYIFTGRSFEAYVGVVISVFIIKAGIEMLLETMNDILGRRSDPDVVKKIKECVNKEEEVRGTYDVIVNDYGPGKFYASFHIEIPDTMKGDELDVLTRKIEKDVYLETGIIVTAVGVYSYNTKDNQEAKIRENVLKLIKTHDWALQMHGFFVDIEKKTMRFDVVVSFDIKTQEAIKILLKDMENAYPDYKVQITPDLAF